MGEDPAALARIEGKIDVLTERVGNVIPQVQDHENRLRTVESTAINQADAIALIGIHAISKKALWYVIGGLTTIILAACSVLGLMLHH